MKILILGGTGAMGVHLVRQLAQRGDTVYVTTRKTRPNTQNVNYVVGNAHDNGFLSPILQQGWDCIVDFMSYNTDEFRTRATKILSSTKHYIFLSSSRVYANSETPITEDSPRLLDVCNDKEFIDTDEYAITKARQENILMDNDLRNWTIIRPYITYSEQRLQLGVMEKEEWLFVVLNGNTLIFSNDIASKATTLTYGSDVANGIASLIGKSEAFGEAFHITVSTPIKWQSVMDIYTKVLSEHGINPKIIMDDECYRLKNKMAKYQVIYDRHYNRVFNNSKIARFVDVGTFKNPTEGLAECLNEFLKKPSFKYTAFENAVNNHSVKIPLAKISDNKEKLKYMLMRFGIYDTLKNILHK